MLLQCFRGAKRWKRFNEFQRVQIMIAAQLSPTVSAGI
jgi:hypothetical protein